jgi:hypothetical protein
MSMKEGLCPVGGQASVNVGVYAFPANGSSVNKPVFWISGDEYYYLAGVQCSPSRSLTFAAVVNGSGTNVANVTSIFVQVTRQGSPGPWQVPIPSNSCSVNQAFAILITDTNGIHHDPMIVVTPG